MGANELSALLWRERELLELLVFKLEEEQLLLTAGKTRWLQHATREVEQVMERLRDAELGRSVELASVAAEWGTSEDATLRELAEAAPDGPWAEVFTAHLQGMRELAAQIKELRDLNEQLLRDMARSAQETLAGVSGAATTYTARGRSGDGTGTNPQLFEKSL